MMGMAKANDDARGRSCRP